jgi:hypothetical protein
MALLLLSEDAAMTKTLTDAQTQELVQLKRHFPYRIVYGALDPETGEFIKNTAYDKRKPNKLARQGFTVFLLGS